VHEALEELPQLDADIRERMLAALQSAIDHDSYVAFLEAPAPNFSLPLGKQLEALRKSGHSRVRFKPNIAGSDMMSALRTGLPTHAGLVTELQTALQSFDCPADSSQVVHYNRCVPLPLGLVDISIRLAGGFYRQPAALRHDVQLLASNARLFNDDQAAIITVADGEHDHMSRHFAKLRMSCSN
jgi:Bromodomain